MEFSAEMIAGYLSGDIVGDRAATVNTISKIEEGTPGSLSFLANPKYEPYVYTTKATIVIVNRSFEPKEPVAATLIKVDDAYACFARLLEMYAASKARKAGIHSSASISESATLGENCYVGQFAVIGDNCSVGNNSSVYPQVWIGDSVRIGENVTIGAGAKIYEHTVIGDNVHIEAGAVIGADGFGYAPNQSGTYDKVPQIGNVVIEDEVYIGANTCIDRATMGSTRICKGAKIDNLIQIGHNVVIGANTVMAAQVGVAGSTKVGEHCMFGGQVGIAGHLEIGDKVIIGSQSGISNNLKSGNTYFGYPAMQGLKYHRSSAVFRNLPQMSIDVSNLKKEVAKIRQEYPSK